MDKEKNEFKSWKDLRIGITGASGALGSSLAKDFREAGSYVIGLTSKKIDDIDMGISNLPHEWVKWQCGEEKNISNIIKSLDILILNHGINYQGNQNNNSIINFGSSILPIALISGAILNPISFVDKIVPLRFNFLSIAFNPLFFVLVNFGR